MKKDKKIYMERESYERYLNGIEELIEEKKQVDLKMAQVHKKGTAEAWDNAEFEEYREESFRLGTEIINRRLSLSDIIVVDSQNNEELVGFGDILRLNLFDQYGNDEIIGKLVGDAKKSSMDSDYLEISANGLVGSLIYGKKVGEKISYIVDGFTCYVQIIEKLNNKKETKKTNNVKKLEKIKKDK